MLYSGEFIPYVPNDNTATILGMAFNDINNLKTFVYDEEGNLTRFVKETYNSTLRTYQDIIAGTSNETLESDGGVYQTIKDTISGDFNEMVNESDLFAQRVGNLADESYYGQFALTADNLSLGLFGEEGMISGLGIVDGLAKLKADKIHLDGDTYIETAYIENLVSDLANIGELTSSRAVLGNVISSHIDARSITVGRGDFIEAGIHDLNSDMYLTGSHLMINSHSGWDLLLSRSGVTINNEYGSQIGRLSASRRSGSSSNVIGVNANRGSYVVLGYQGPNGMGTYNEAITINGTSGLVTLGTGEIEYAHTGYGIRLSYQSGIDYVYGLNSSSYGIGFGSGDVWYVISGTRYGLNAMRQSISSLASRVSSLESRI